MSRVCCELGKGPRAKSRPLGANVLKKLRSPLPAIPPELALHERREGACQGPQGRAASSKKELVAPHARPFALRTHTHEVFLAVSQFSGCDQQVSRPRGQAQAQAQGTRRAPIVGG